MNDKSLCRLTRFGKLSREEYGLISCVQCYNYLLYVFKDFIPSFNTSHHFFLTDDNRFLNPKVPNDITEIKKTMDQSKFDKWRECCDQADFCCDSMINQNIYPKEQTFEDDPSYCGSIWDGWSCHQTTKSGHVSTVKCPDHHVADTCHTVLGYINFDCTENGTWYSNEFGEWANYSACLDPFLESKYRLININIVCNLISLVFLVAGLIIFFSYRKLKVDRIEFHKHFFFSMILHSIFQLIWDYEFMSKSLKNPEKYIESNSIVCIIMNVLLHYTRSTNYFWMFNESFYLLRLLTHVFKDQSNLRLYYFIGWGVPFIICLTYVLFSLTFGNDECWTRNLRLNYIISIPNIVILIANILSLAYVIKVLYNSLRNHSKSEIRKYKKSIRSTLVLVPLFGIHFLISPIIICESNPFSIIHNTVNRAIENSQGLIVALIYCFMNSEVKNLLKKSLNKMKLFARFGIIKKFSESSNETMELNTNGQASQTYSEF